MRCRECGAGWAGTRSEARRAGWECWATRTQWDLDHGPMVCGACVARVLDDALDALRAWARRAWRP